MAERQIPGALRAVLNIVALFGVGATLMGWVSHPVGISILIIAAVYFVWEISPWAADKARRKPMLSLIVFVLIGGILGAGVWWGVRKLNQHAGTPETPNSNPHPTTSPASVPPTSQPTVEPHTIVIPAERQFPLVVKVNIDWQQVLHFQNLGKTDIQDVGLGWALFNLDEAAWASQKIIIKNGSYPMNIPYVLSSRVKPGLGAEVPLDKIVPFKMTFKEAMYLPQPQPEIGLRITFRDSQTGQKYACYKVFSTVKGMPEPWGDAVGKATPPPGEPYWLDELPKLVIADMKEKMNDDAIDFKCDR
jgi:hypothetical protein